MNKHPRIWPKESRNHAKHRCFFKIYRWTTHSTSLRNEPGLHETFSHGSDEPHPISRPKWPKALAWLSTEELTLHSCNQTLMFIRRDAISTLVKVSQKWKLGKRPGKWKTCLGRAEWIISQGLVYRWLNVRVHKQWIPNYPSSISCIYAFSYGYVCFSKVLTC